MAARAHRSTEELREIIMDMELEQEDFSLNETAYDVRWILERKNTELTEEAVRFDRTISMEVDEDVPRIMIGDPTRIGGMIERVVMRCLDYSGDDPISIHISSQKETYSVRLIISIRDKDARLSDEEVAAIGNVMGSADRIAITDEVQLYDSFAIMGFVVRAMNGRTELNSLPDGGIDFTIAIPQLVGE